MRRFVQFLFLFAFSAQALCWIVPKERGRQARWFGRGAYTSTVLKEQLVTSLIPSSCVQYAATLPPCRNVRLLNVPEARFLFSSSNKNENTTEVPAVKSAAEEKEANVETTVMGWGEYLGFYAPTVTVTTTRFDVTKVLDSRTVLTFSVSGCRPSKLPMDLPKCPDINDNMVGVVTPTSVQDIAPIATSTIFTGNSNSIATNTDAEAMAPNLHQGEGNVLNDQAAATATEPLIATPQNVNVRVQGVNQRRGL